MYIDGDFDTDAESGEGVVDVRFHESGSGAAVSPSAVVPDVSKESLGGETTSSAVDEDSDSMTLSESLEMDPFGSNATARADAIDSEFFGSGRFGSATSYRGEEEGADGEAEREAEEFQALVAEALALVREASEDA